MNLEAASGWAGGEDEPVFGMTVDVEEWYHTCLVPEYVDPSRRPAGLTEELDFLLPELLQLLASNGATATFFVLGEVAQRHPSRVREIQAAGHEVASHSYLHFRAGDLSLSDFEHQARRSRHLLEDLIGVRVCAFRAPEWSLRHPANPRLAALSAAGYSVDSSLAPFLGAGRWSNPKRPYTITIENPEGSSAGLLELPPLVFGGLLRLPAGSWTGRLMPPDRLLEAARSEATAGGLPVFVVHPWEISGRPTPGKLRGFARFVHETGRSGYRARFEDLLRGASWRSLAELLRRRAATSFERRYTLRAGESTRDASAFGVAGAEAR